MAPKVWNFFLPATGAHQLRVEDIGTPQQQVFLNDEPFICDCRRTVFTGPENALLELRGGGANWSLLVNGLVVEDYIVGKRASGDESIRELRSKPEGSYLISPDFQVSDIELNVVRKFKFLCCGHMHEVKVAHSDCIWQVISDGKIVDRVKHNLSNNYGDTSFEVELASGQKLKAHVTMQWYHIRMIWSYKLSVDGVDIPMCWSKVSGHVRPAVDPPVVVAEDASRQPFEVTELSEPPAEQFSGDIAFGTSVATESLPQGVSFDTATGAYQANIRGKAGKFIFLGEFETPDEAHQAYLRAVPIHRPEANIVPQLPS